MRPPHYWKKSGPAAAPSNIMVLDTETWHGDRAICAGGEYHTLRLGCYFAYRLEGGRRTRISRDTFRNSGDCWTAIESRLDSRRPLWIFAHNMPYDFGVIEGWSRITSDDWTTERAAITSTMFYLKGSYKGLPIVLCDTINYYKCSLESIGKAVGRPKMTMPSQDESDEVWERYCMNDVDVTADGVDALIRFVRDNNLGPWQPTVAGLAFSAYKCRYLYPKVLVHDYEPVLQDERSAYYGGVVDTPRIGTVIKGPIYEMDVASMYPYCCLLDMPYQYVGTRRNPGRNQLYAYLDQYMCVAKVHLRTTTNTYPCRVAGRTYYPTGEYTTTLADPELRESVTNGDVESVDVVHLYNAAAIFHDYMTAFGDMKVKYDREGNDAFRTLCKYYMNSLYGKTGQMTPHWAEWGMESLRYLEKTHDLQPGTLAYLYGIPPSLYEPEEEYQIPEIGESVKVRDLYGVVEIQIGEYESRDSCPAIAATVTSAARCLLRRYQRIAGWGNWYYTDTDSLWCNAEGKKRLEERGCVSDGDIGKLVCKDPHDRMLIYGPKDYETDRIRRMKGIRSKAKQVGPSTFMQLQFPSALSQLKAGTKGGVFVKHVTKELRRSVDRVRLLRGGHTRPLRFPQEAPKGYTND